MVKPGNKDGKEIPDTKNKSWAGPIEIKVKVWIKIWVGLEAGRQRSCEEKITNFT